MTKKVKNIYGKMRSIESVESAIAKTIKHKSSYKAVKRYNKNPQKYVDGLKDILDKKSFKVSEFDVIVKVNHDKKERVIPKIPLFYDQAIQHCLLENTWLKYGVKKMTDDAYNCIKGRGINSKEKRWCMVKKVKRAIAELSKSGRVYYAKCDIRKHYPYTRHSSYRKAYRHLFSDKDVLNLYDRLNYSWKGIPIGWPTGSPASHMIMMRLDHWVKEEMKVKYYFRFADDIVLLDNDKKRLHECLRRIQNFMWYELKQQMKGNYKVWPIEEGMDFGGYVFYKEHTYLRKSIKKRMAKKRHNPKSMASYYGLLKACDSKNLIKEVIKKDNKHMTSIKDIGVKIDKRFWGKKITIDNLEGETIKILDFEVRDSVKEEGKLWLRMQIEFNGKKRFVKTSSQDIAKFLSKVDHSLLPLEDVVIKRDEGGCYYIEGTINE